jgi:hypothetical protein
MVSQIQLSTNFALLSLKPNSTQLSLLRNEYSSSQVFSLYATIVVYHHVSAIPAQLRPCSSAKNIMLSATKLMGKPRIHTSSISPSSCVFVQWYQTLPMLEKCNIDPTAHPIQPNQLTFSTARTTPHYWKSLSPLLMNSSPFGSFLIPEILHLAY